MSRDVKRIQRILLIKVWMALGPLRQRGELVKLNSLFNLQPTEDDVVVRRTFHIRVSPSRLGNLSEPSKEQKDVACADAIFPKVTFRGASLSEERAPTWFPREALISQIRIDVRAVGLPGSTV